MKKTIIWIVWMVLLFGCTACRLPADEEPGPAKAAQNRPQQMAALHNDTEPPTAPIVDSKISVDTKATAAESNDTAEKRPVEQMISSAQLAGPAPTAETHTETAGKSGNNAVLCDPAAPEMDCRILLYHHFTQTAPSKKKYSVITTPQRLEENIKYLLEQGYTIIPLQALVEYHRGTRTLPQKTVVLTMDDGYESNYTLAYPILQKYRVPATIFVVASAMNEGNKMSWEQMREMEQSGLVDIQSHSISHIDHSALPPAEAAAAVEESFTIIEKNLGKRKYRMFAYPYGKHTDQTVTALQEQGVDVQLTTQYRAVDLTALRPERLPRLNVAYHSDLETLLQYTP